MPTTPTSRLVAWTSVLLLARTIASPMLTLPAASLSLTCQTASQAPRSDQPASSGTMRMSKCARARAFLHHRVVDRLARDLRELGLAGPDEAGVGGLDRPGLRGWRRRCRA